MLKKIALSSILAFACFGTTASANNIKTTVIPYTAYFHYGHGKIDSKKVVGSTLLQKLNNSDSLMLDLKYVKLSSSVINPHKMTLATEYTLKHLNGPLNYQIGVSYTNAYFPESWGGFEHVYSVWGGVVEKKPILLKSMGIKTGVKLYYTDYRFQKGQKLWQLDLNNYKKISLAHGKLLLRNTLSLQSFKNKDIQGNNKYTSDVLNAKYMTGHMVYMGHMKIGNSALKVEQDAKYMIDTVGLLHKFGIGAGVGYKLSKKSMTFAKVRYNRIKEKCGTGESTNSYEMKYVVGFKTSF